MLTDERFAPYLQDAYYTQREDRYVLPVRTDGKGFVRGIVHGTSQSGQTLFIEPEEIVDLNNRMKLAEAEVADEERRILIKFSGWVAEEADGVRAVARRGRDARRDRRGRDHGRRHGRRPSRSSTRRRAIALLHARHPLMLLAERRCVANDVTVAAGHDAARLGPERRRQDGRAQDRRARRADGARRPAPHRRERQRDRLVPDVVTDIGDAQNLEKDLSTFSGHMVNLRELLATAAPGTLVLIDEIAVGTDPDQGAALAQAVLEALAARGVTGIVTTHYERLKALGATDPRFANASVGFDLERLEPTFKLHLGSPGSSGALAVATRMGIAGAVVERARELLGAARRARRGAARERRRSAAPHRGGARRAARRARGRRGRARRDAHRSARSTHARFEKQTRAAHGEALSALRAARREIEEVPQATCARRPREADARRRHATRRASSSRRARTVAQHEPQRPAAARARPRPPSSSSPARR